MGILTPVQPANTPYSQCHRYVSKKAVKALLSKSHSRVTVGETVRRDVIQERPVYVAVTTGRALIVSRIKVIREPIKTIVERQYSRPTHPVPVTRAINCSPNENLDLCYPERMRVTVHHIHPGFDRGCE